MQCIFKFPSIHNINSVHEICDWKCCLLTACDILEMKNIDISYCRLEWLCLPLWHTNSKNNIMLIFEQKTPLSCALHPLSVYFLSTACYLPINSTPGRKQYTLPNYLSGSILYLNSLFIFLKFFKRSLAYFCFIFPVVLPFNFCISQPCSISGLITSTKCPCSLSLLLSIAKLSFFLQKK